MPSPTIVTTAIGTSVRHIEFTFEQDSLSSNVDLRTKSAFAPWSTVMLNWVITANLRLQANECLSQAKQVGKHP